MRENKMQAIYSPNIFGNSFYVEHVKSLSKTSMKIDHYHDFYELYFYLGDGMRYFIGNKTYYVKKYDLVLIDKFTYHRTSYKDKGTRERMLVYVTEDVLNIIDDENIKQKVIDLFKRKKISFYDSFKKHILNTFMNRILPEYHNNLNSSIGNLQSKLLLVDLLLEIVELSENGEVFEDNNIASPHEKRISDIVDYINSNYSNHISLDELCNLFYINKYYLCHIFKDITGMSIIEFINRKRLAEAKKLLKYTDYSITDISDMVGFNSVSRFISLFKKKYDLTPKAFRNSGEYRAK
ncbi:MAG: helix-turn-helix transcriptional regulator [Firmicutes bacterium]|nr:helix-turn-helix transcriptional regulator [Bacillota bacterium]